jgi:hypothetical protein
MGGAVRGGAAGGQAGERRKGPKPLQTCSLCFGFVVHGNRWCAKHRLKQLGLPSAVALPLHTYTHTALDDRAATHHAISRLQTPNLGCIDCQHSIPYPLPLVPSLIRHTIHFLPPVHPKHIPHYTYHHGYGTSRPRMRSSSRSMVSYTYHPSVQS